MDTIKRQDKLDSMSEIDLKLESIDTLNDMIILYKKSIDTYLNDITPNLTLQDQIKTEMAIVN